MNPLLLQSLLALLPLFGLKLGALRTLCQGVLGGGLLVFTTMVFLVIRKTLPRPLHRLSFFLLLLVDGMMIGEIFSLSLLWIPSLFLLTPPDLFRRRTRAREVVDQTLALALSFAALSAGGGILTGILGNRWGVNYFLGGLLLAFFQGRQKIK